MLGFGWGLLLVSFASSIGATVSFLVARYVLRDVVHARFGARLADIDRGMERDGALYLFSLRLIPVVPFFAINLAMGLTTLHLDLLLGQPARHAGGHCRVCECGHAAR